MVCPNPSKTFLSNTVQLNDYLTATFFFKNVDVYLTITDSKSGIPSPVIPEVGTIDTYELGSRLSQ